MRNILPPRDPRDRRRLRTSWSWCRTSKWHCVRPEIQKKQTLNKHISLVIKYISKGTTENRG